MKTLDSGQDKIQKICDKLRHETLEPAKEEARLVIVSAKQRADEIIAEAEKQAEHNLKRAREQIEQERNVFYSSLQQASKQVVETLKQEIERRLFNEQLPNILDKSFADPKIVAQLINGIVKALEKDGIKGDLAAVIPHTVPPEQVVLLLLEETKKRLSNKALEIGPFTGGVQIKLINKRMTIDLTDQALIELLAAYVRKDFRQIIFSH